MKQRRCAGIAAACLLTIATAAAADDAPLFRVFLKDGPALVSYGEFAHVGDRVVFSIPLGSADANPALHLMDIAADRVDWDRTNRYADSARTLHYISTQAENDYTALSNDVAQTLNAVALAPDAVKRLALVESARNTLADWPRNHFNYRSGEVRQMLAMLDDAIADLRAATGGAFHLTLAAYAGDSPVLEPLLPPPTPKDAIEQALFAARIAESSSTRESLLLAALTALDRSTADLPAEWAASVRDEASTSLRNELIVDRAYQTLSARLIRRAGQRARNADVRGVERILAALPREDRALGGARPDAVGALVAAVRVELDAARRLQLARDRWAMRAPEFQRYDTAITAPVDLFGLFARVSPALEDIKSLAGSTPVALGSVTRIIRQIVKRASQIAPPDEFRAAHALIVSAAQMADTAAAIRREAALSGDMARAWDASSAAAGALMLWARAKNEINTLLRQPDLASLK